MSDYKYRRGDIMSVGFDSLCGAMDGDIGHVLCGNAVTDNDAIR